MSILSGLPYAVRRVKLMTMGLGVFMLLVGVFMSFELGISLLIGGVFIITGIFGVVAGRRIKVPNAGSFPPRPGVVVEVRCQSCNALNSEGAQFCSKCGSKL